MVKVGWPCRRMLDFFLLSVGCWEAWRALDVRRLRSDFLCASVLDRRSVARMDAATSGEGASPNMKNLIKAANSNTTDIWPTMRPCVKERLELASQLFDVILQGAERYARWLWFGGTDILSHPFGRLVVNSGTVNAPVRIF